MKGGWSRLFLLGALLLEHIILGAAAAVLFQEDGGVECESLASKPALRPALFYVRSINPDCLYDFQISIVIYSQNFAFPVSPSSKEKYPMIDLLIQDILLNAYHESKSL